ASESLPKLRTGANTPYRVLICFDVDNFDIARAEAAQFIAYRSSIAFFVEELLAARPRQAVRSRQVRGLRQRVVRPQPPEEVRLHDLGFLREVGEEDADADAAGK